MIVGYKALILFSEGKRSEGLTELNTYIAACRNLQPLSPSMKDAEFNVMYGRSPPSASLKSVELIAASGQIDIRQLEQLIDQQMKRARLCTTSCEPSLCQATAEPFLITAMLLSL